jgi:predicted RNase H-like HicB family nuclease
VKIEPGEDGYFVASCPGLPGCFSQGRTFDEAVENITEAIEAYTECLGQEESAGDVALRLVKVTPARE